MGFIDFILHIYNYIGGFIQNYGYFTYFMLFGILFLETGFVITPFLPGDSLLFISGTFAAQGALNLFVLLVIFSLGAILGDSVNYFIGNYFGEKVFSGSRFFHKEYLEKTKKFYDKHGNKTIILARFIPIMRTFAPFVAGVAKMDYPRFLFYNIMGGISWVALFLLAGYFLGNVTFVKYNLTSIIFLIIIISLIPVVLDYINHKRKKNVKI